MINIRQASETDREKWDVFVHELVDVAPYHLSAWTGAVRDGYGFESLKFIAEEDGGISGVFAATIFKIPLKGNNLVALPYCDLGGVLGRSSEVRARLVHEAVAYARKHGMSVIDIRGEIEADQLKADEFQILSGSGKVRMLMDLPSSSTELWKGFKSKLRSQIRKAEKNGLVFRFENNSVDSFYSVFTQNMRDLGSPVHSRKWFSAIRKGYGENCRIGVVSYQDKPVGAGIILRVGNNISIPWASTLRAYNHLGPNMLLYWKLLEYAADNSCRVFDFGRSTPDEGTYRFKAQWGATPIPLIWDTLYLDKKPTRISNGSGKNRERAEKIWQILPLSAANFLGPLIRKYISL